MSETQESRQASADYNEAYWRGYYNACRVLLTSPRMDALQVEVIETQVTKARDELSALGVKWARAQKRSS